MNRSLSILMLIAAAFICGCSKLVPVYESECVYASFIVSMDEQTRILSDTSSKEINMSFIKNFHEVLDYAKKEYENKEHSPFLIVDGLCDEKNQFVFGDNLDYMKYLLSDGNMTGKIQQIYIDPPFYSKSNYDAWVKDPINSENKIKKRAYDDIWKEGMEEYLKMLAVRLMFMKDLLKDDGTIWIHLDWHGVHYVKVLMDEIFGRNNAHFY